MSTADPYFADDIDEELPLSPESAQATWIAYGALVALATFAYWEVLRFTSSFWDEGLYSHGWIVPVLAMGLLYMRSSHAPELPTAVIGGAAAVLLGLYVLARMTAGTPQGPAEQAVGLPTWFPMAVVAIVLGVFIYVMRDVRMYHVVTRDRWIGVAVIAASMAAWLWASRIDMNPVNRLSYVGVLFGLTLLMGGVRMLRWAGPAIAVLLLMFPLPSVLEHSLLLFLQKLAAISSTWVLQLLGITAMRDGNRLVIDTLELEVADACSGLRMLTIFGAMSMAVALLIDRPWWDRLCILISAIPIALITNIIRIVATALLFKWFTQENELVNRLIHDWAGLVMMPIALGLLWLEYEVLTRLSIPIDPEDEYSAGGFGTATAKTRSGVRSGVPAS